MIEFPFENSINRLIIVPIITDSLLSIYVDIA